MKICLCGSTKFEGDFHRVSEALALAGHIVHEISVYPSQKNGEKNWYTEEQKQILDVVHFAKIEASDAIFVIDVDNYIGPSTAREIIWAKMLGKKIFHLSLCDLGYLRHAGPFGERVR